LTYVVHLAGDPTAAVNADLGFRLFGPNNIGGTKNIYEAARLAA